MMYLHAMNRGALGVKSPHGSALTGIRAGLARIHRTIDCAAWLEAAARDALASIGLDWLPGGYAPAPARNRAESPFGVGFRGRLGAYPCREQERDSC